MKRKNQWLKEMRNLSFEAIAIALEQEKLVDIVQNPSGNHKDQPVLIVEIEGYLVFVPFVEDEERLFFKTAFRNRKFNKRRDRGKQNETT